MFRFLFFIFGVCSGFALAITMLPLPGKTFFNRMSKLPSGLKTLVDNGIDLSIAVFRIGFTISKEASIRGHRLFERARDKFDEIKLHYRKARRQRQAETNGNMKETEKAKVGS